MTTDLELLRELCAAPAPTGWEAPAQEVVRRRLATLGAVHGDPIGNVWCDVVPDGTPHVVVTGHSDQIGLIVTYVDDHGFVSFAGVGGIDAQLLPGRHLVVHNPKGQVHGIVGRKPSHKMTPEERAKAPEIGDQWLDVGATSREEALELVQVGDPITFPAQWVALANERFASPAFDNRAGVYTAIRALEHYAAAPAAARLTALATTHEETTSMGAKSIARRWQPDVVIVVDVDFASDDPGLDARKLGGEVRLGGGPIVKRGAGSNHVLVELAREVAAAEDIPIQLKASPGRTSTDAEELMAAGQAATLSLGLPLRNMHSAAEVVQPSDFEAASVLCAALTRRLAQGWERERLIPRV